MNGRYLWVEGELDILPGFGKTHHAEMMKRMREEGRIPPRPTNYAGGDFSTSPFHEDLPPELTLIWSAGTHPDKRELAQMVAVELASYGRESSYRQRAVSGQWPWQKTQPIMQDTMEKSAQESEPANPDTSTRNPDTSIHYKKGDGTMTPEQAVQRWVELAGRTIYHSPTRGGEINELLRGIEVGQFGVTFASSPLYLFGSGRANPGSQLLTYDIMMLDPNKISSMILYPWDGQQVMGEFGYDGVLPVNINPQLRERFRGAATSEDTEGAGENVGFLADPHPDLYSPLFRGDKRIPVEVASKLKAHVLNALEEDFQNPDNFIYFTIYGSGLSYNWDEGGDLDIQMWVDLEKFQSLHEEGATMTMDDLLATIRRRVQTVNFPSFKDLGLQPPNGDESGATGSMLIQYYPKPGKGTPEENLASQPYACYDLETGDWLAEPEPISPTFYGQHFADLMPKAEDMAHQAEALISEFERNVLNWQFWFSLYSRYRNPVYFEQYSKSMQDATMEKEGIVTMFEGIFGGRAEAYSPGGKGIEDERDMIQKLLEVWGIFQRLKHYARAPLPWDEQKLPGSPEKTSMADRTGNPEIDALIEEFLQTPQGDWTSDETPIEMLRNPELAHGMCDAVTEQFVAFAKARGFRAYVTQTDLEEMGYKPSIEPFGEVGFDENDEMQYGFYPEHTIATIVLDDPQFPYGREFYIDFTATQYGYTDHPKVTSGWKIVASNPQEILDMYPGERLQDYPGAVNVPGIGKLDFGAHSEIQQIANDYVQSAGIEYKPPRQYAPVDPDRAKRIAEEYEKAEHNPNDPAVADSYEALKSETAEQYKHIIEAGYTFDFYPDEDPYPNSPREAVLDLYTNKHMYVYPTDAGFGQEDEDSSDHPLLEQTGIKWGGKPVTYNDLFRAVHDFFGHAKEGVGFRADGEENAWRQHAAMYSERAQAALAAETRGQNSWVNYGPHGEQNQNANQAETVYADQKAVALPEWTWQEGRGDSEFVTQPGGFGTFSRKAAEGSPEHDDPGGWQGIMQKAQRLREEGGVQVMRNGAQNVVGQVQGDHGLYDTEIWRDDPGKGTITLWNCTCPWNDYSWGRTRQFKKYEGRPCAHTLALYWESLTMQLDAEEGQDEQLQLPGEDWNPVPAIKQTLPSQQQQPAQPAAPPESVLKGPTDVGLLELPGTFSSWRRTAVLQNGDYVRAIVPVDGRDERDTYYVVPRNMIGEVIWADEEESIVIFSIESPALGPFNVRVEAPAESFRLVPREKGTAPRRRRIR